MLCGEIQTNRNVSFKTILDYSKLSDNENRMLAERNFSFFHAVNSFYCGKVHVIYTAKFLHQRKSFDCIWIVWQVGIYSFNGNKIITTSGGGMLFSYDDELIKKVRFWATQAGDPRVHYEHSEMGYNYRMSNVLAAIGRGQLRVLAERVEGKRRVFTTYLQALSDLPGVTFMPEPDFYRSTRWLTCMTVDPQAAGNDRDAIIKALDADNIESRPTWKPMHLQPLFKGCEMLGGAVSDRLFAQGICLPSGTSMSEADLARVILRILSCWS